MMHRLLLPQGALRAQWEKYTFSLNKVRKKAYLEQHMVLPVCSLKLIYDLAGHLADVVHVNTSSGCSVEVTTSSPLYKEKGRGIMSEISALIHSHSAVQM